MAADSPRRSARRQANVEVRKAKKAVARAETTERGGDDRRAAERLKVAKQNRRDLRQANQGVREARRARATARETAGRADDRRARNQAQNARENRRAVRARVRNPREQMPDVLSDRVIAQEYGYAWRTIKANPELLTLFRRATNASEGVWAKERFIAELQNTEWYTDNNEWYRRAFEQETAGGADWEEQMQTARDAVQRAASAMGAPVPEDQLDDLARDYLYNGWYDKSREGMFQSYMTETFGLDTGAGEAGNLADKYREIAQANGMQYSDGWYESAARSIAMGLSTPEDWERQIRQDAASSFPVYREQIEAGMNVADLASGYINTMAQTLEVDPSTINLRDTHIRAALGGVDEQGNPKAMGMWDFEKSLRNDPRWGYTKNARSEGSQYVSSLLKNFGIIG